MTTIGGTGFTSHGISVKSGNLVVESGTITATGRDAAGSSGIYASGNITIKNGAVRATDNSYGLRARNWEISEIGTGSMDLQGMTAAYSVNGNNSGEKEYATGKRVLKSRDFNFIAPTDLIYDGQGKTASVTPDREAATEDADQVCADCRWIITNKLGHVHKIHLEKVEAKEATCTEEGNQAYYKCTEDQKCFLDENAETEVYESDMKIQEAGHRAGDNSDVMLWLILTLSSAGAILWFGTRRKQGR